MKLAGPVVGHTAAFCRRAKATIVAQTEESSEHAIVAMHQTINADYAMPFAPSVVAKLNPSADVHSHGGGPPSPHINMPLARAARGIAGFGISLRVLCALCDDVFVSYRALPISSSASGLSSEERSPRSLLPRWRARISRRSTLPLRVLGSWRTKSTASA